MTEFSSDWASRAACRVDPDRMFVSGVEQNDAKRICGSCAVKAECLAEALDNHIEFGVWGGLTERQRRAVLRKHPNVKSWRTLFQATARKAEAARAAGDGDRSVEVAGAAGAVATGVELPESGHVIPGLQAIEPEEPLDKGF